MCFPVKECRRFLALLLPVLTPSYDDAVTLLLLLLAFLATLAASMQAAFHGGNASNLSLHP